MRLMITGASGFIGTNAVAYFAPLADALVNLDIVPPLDSVHAAYWQCVDIMDRQALAAAVRAFAPTHCIHMAARTECDETTTVEAGYQVNTVGTGNVLAAVKACSSVERLIVVSSQFVCGPGPLPSNDTEFFPHTVYGQSKVISEQLTRAAELSCAWTIVRPTNVWGPWHLRYVREAWRIIRMGLYLHPGGEPVVRSYGYVGNVVWQMAQILKADSVKVNQAVYYLGDLPVDIREWVDAFALQLRGRPVRVVPRPVLCAIGRCGDVATRLGIPFPLTSSRVKSMTTNYLTPMDKTFDAFGEPPYTLDQGVADTLDWMQHEAEDG